MARDGDDKEQGGQDHVEGKHDASLGEATRARCEDERGEEQPRVDVAGDLRDENRKHQDKVRTLKRHEASEQTSTDRQERIRAMSGLQVVILPTPREPGERNAREQNHLENRETQERDTTDDRDDLGHPNTVAAGRWGLCGRH